MRRSKVSGFFEEDFNIGESIMIELDNYIRYHELKNSSTYTIKNIIYTINKFNEWLILENNKCFMDCNKVDARTIQKYISHMKDVDMKVSSINSSIKFLRSFFNYLEKTKRIKHSPFHKGDIRLLTEDKEIKYVISEDEFNTMLRSLDLTMFKDITTYTILNILWYTGMRINEVSHLEIDDVEDDKIIIRKTKNRQSRIIPLNSKLKRTLDSYIRIRGTNLKERRLLLSVNNKPLSRETISRKIKDVVRKAECNEQITAHSFRRSAITRMIKQNVPLKVVMEISGHNDIKTITEKYIEISEEQKFDAIEKL